MDYSSIESLTALWQITAKQFAEIVALQDPHNKPEVKITYQELARQTDRFAAGLQALGVEEQFKVSLFADNSPRWLIADRGIISAGAVDVVRSSQADKEELLYILQDSDSTSLVVEDLKTLKKLKPQLDELPINLIVLLSDEKPEKDETRKILNFTQLIAIGTESELKPVEQKRETLATLIYTSGTTGQPKGVMLSHGNFLHQINSAAKIVKPTPGDRVLSILPSWHSYERTVEYFLLAQGCTQIYTNIRSVKKDFREFKPQYMVGVPRLWESIYEGVQKQFREQPANRQKLINFFFDLSHRYIFANRIADRLSLEHLDASPIQRLQAKIQAAILYPLHLLGEKIVYEKVRQATGGQIKTLISGGGSLAMHLDTFFEIVGVNILVGYGLTETSPITNLRIFERNLRGSAGQPLAQTEIRIVDPKTRQDLPTGERGLVLIRGPQVMQGYYNKPEATAKAIDPDGWFDSGDLGWLTPNRDLVLTGRAKDTIVLTNGENIEPQPIEDACARSAYINQIMLVGQDRRSIGALIVPNLEALAKWGSDRNLDLKQEEKSLNSNTEVQNLFRQELNREVKDRPGYRADDRVGPFILILEPFSQENGMMTQTMKIKRPAVTERYKETIDRMYE
jgi:long-chain acyl-CoA synthetase